MIACRPNKNITFLKKKSIHLKFHHSASEKLIKKNRAFNPNYFVDIDKTYKKKIFILKIL